MALLHSDKKHLSDLDFSLTREYLLVNQTGSYCSSTIMNCNTRKYHGLFIAMQPQIDNDRYVLLSALDETLVDGDKEFGLATQRCLGKFQPDGYHNMESFTCLTNPQWIIKADGFKIKKELLLVQKESRLLIQYTILNANKNAELKLTPFLAFRNIYSVSQANMNVINKVTRIPNGIKLKLYPEFDELHMQLSSRSNFIKQQPNWYYNIEYPMEMNRGYEFNEALYCAGYFCFPIKKGDKIIFTAGFTQLSPRSLSVMYNRELNKQPTLNSFKNCLENAASQFIVARGKETEMTAGYHWYRRWGRDTFISLPGLTLCTDKPEVFKAVISSMEKQLRGGLFPNMGNGISTHFNTADASLWYFWALQQYSKYTHNAKQVWKEHGEKMQEILDAYLKGTLHHIHMQKDGLIYAGEQGIYVTWMDAIIDGKPVTPRTGLAVELSALWYNAICFSLEAAAKAGDNAFTKKWSMFPERIKNAFNKRFWNSEKGYLADCIFEEVCDWSFRPNQIFAVSLPYSPLDYKQQKSIVDLVKKKLLTPRGLRSLAPDDIHYKGKYYGNQRTRDLSYHQGTVWPWLIGHFTEAYLRIYGESGKKLMRKIYTDFAPAILEGGMGTVSEIYDGDIPQKPRGAISQAWSVAELIRMRKLINEPAHGKKPLTQ
ncbi:MAG TPA: amylo-alpha-1,6-glucosidase [Bacteroidia bacterium]|nr:amylo-alpha-1,6-glucosidase [Bacteroidia bacterium]